MQKHMYALAGYLLSKNDSECGVVQVSQHFARVQSVSGNPSIASFIAAIPCARKMARTLATFCIRIGRKLA